MTDSVLRRSSGILRKLLRPGPIPKAGKCVPDIRVCCDRLLVYLQAKAWDIRQLECAVPKRVPASHQLVPPGHIEFREHSWIMKFGVHISRWRAAARATGPIEQCGEINRSWAAAIAAIFLLVSMPPQCATSI